MRHAARILPFPQRRVSYGDGSDAGGASDRGSGVFDGLKVLLVEDDFIVAFDMQMLLEEQGAQVLGPAATLAEAQSIVARELPQLAVLDVNLNGEYVFPLAEELRARAVPFLFATAYADDDRVFPEAARNIPRLAKPVLPNVLIGQLRRLLPR